MTQYIDVSVTSITQILLVCGDITDSDHLVCDVTDSEYLVCDFTGSEYLVCDVTDLEYMPMCRAIKDADKISK